MKLVFDPSKDNHEFIQLLRDSIRGQLRCHRRSKFELEAAKQAVAAFKALPWYKRFFAWYEPCTLDSRWLVSMQKRRTRQLLDLRELVVKRVSFIVDSELSENIINLAYSYNHRTPINNLHFC